MDDEKQAKCAEIVSTCVCLQLRQGSRAVTRLFDEMLKPSGLLSTQLPVLVTLVLSGPTTISGLAEELVMDRTSLTRVMLPLRKREFIEIAPGEDRRTRVVSLTERGSDAIVKAIPLWEKAQARIVERIGHTRLWHLRDSVSATVSATRS